MLLFQRNTDEKKKKEELLGFTAGTSRDTHKIYTYMDTLGAALCFRLCLCAFACVFRAVIYLSVQSSSQADLCLCTQLAYINLFFSDRSEKTLAKKGD